MTDLHTSRQWISDYPIPIKTPTASSPFPIIKYIVTLTEIVIKLVRFKILCFSRNYLVVNTPVSYSRYWTETSLQLKLIWGSPLNANDTERFPPHEPPLHA